MEPLVSILIPTCNRHQLVVKAIKSALAQTYKNIEIVITDNSHGDETKAVIAEIDEDRIVYVKNIDNIGPILNWRKALSIAEGRYCILLPDDDFLINPFYIEDAVGIALGFDVKLVVTDCILGYPGKKQIGASNHSGMIDGKDFIKDFMDGLFIPTIANLFERTAALESNAFYSNDILYSDIELWMKLMSIGNVYCYNIPSVFYLFHTNNIVMNMDESQIITSSRYLRSSVESFADENLVNDLVRRYVLFISSLYDSISYNVIKRVFQENKVNNSGISLFLKLKFARLRFLVKVSITHYLSMLPTFCYGKDLRK